MLEQQMLKGAEDACARFGLKLANVPGLLDRAKAFGMGQAGAAKSLFHNVRGGLGGQYSPEFKGNLASTPGADALNRMGHRAQAVGNLKTLAPSLLAGGGLYMLHRHNKAKEEQARQQQMMAMQGYGHPMM